MRKSAKPEGQCVRCGMCCLHSNRLVYYKYDSGKITFLRFNKRPVWPCMHLIYDIKAREAICVIYESDDRTEICKNYPMTRREVVFDECGFRQT